MRLLTVLVQVGLVGSTAYCAVRVVTDAWRAWRDRQERWARSHGKSVWRP